MNTNFSREVSINCQMMWQWGGRGSRDATIKGIIATGASNTNFSAMGFVRMMRQWRLRGRCRVARLYQSRIAVLSGSFRLNVNGRDGRY